jgi:hypothetical protein
MSKQRDDLVRAFVGELSRPLCKGLFDSIPKIGPYLSPEELGSVVVGVLGSVLGNVVSLLALDAKDGRIALDQVRDAAERLMDLRLSEGAATTGGMLTFDREAGTVTDYRPGSKADADAQDMKN